MSQPAPHAIETRNSSSVPVILSLLLGALALAAPALAPCATPVTSGAAAPASLATAQVVKFKPGMRMSALAGRAPSDLVEFSDGRRMHVGQLQRLQAWARRARGTPRRPIPAAFRARPAATGRRVGDASELLAALKGPDSRTVRLPSGRLATVGQIRFVMPEVDKRLGRPLTAAALPNLSGPALKVGPKSDWKSLLNKPDDTIVEAPDGKRVTVGMIKQALKASASPQRASLQR